MTRAFDLTTAAGRYAARKAGLCVPLRNRPRVKNPWDYISGLDDPGVCWLWTGGLNDDGYGTFVRDGRTRMAHREIWQAIIGPIPPGKVLMHKCDTPRCCNPAHLMVGTQSENRADCVAKNRHAKGERMAAAKLTEKHVTAIRQAHAAGKQQKLLAREYSVSRDLIGKIVHRKYWRHVP